MAWKKQKKEKFKDLTGEEPEIEEPGELEEEPARARKPKPIEKPDTTPIPVVPDVDTMVVEIYRGVMELLKRTEE